MKPNDLPYQTLMTERVLAQPRTALWASMGSGKTRAVLKALDVLRLVERGPALVIAPLRVAQSTWPDEIAKWDDLKSMIVSPILGDVGERRRALHAPADVYTVNFENVPWLVEHCGERWPFSTIIADEATRLAGFRLRQGTARARALAKVAHISSRFIELTGTPAPNGLISLWGQMWFLDKGERLGRTFDAFRQRWFTTHNEAIPQRNGYSFKVPVTKPRDGAQAEIEDRLRDICLTIDAKAYFDIDEPIERTILVQLPAKARAQYREMEKAFYTELSGASVEAFNAASKSMKLLQMASGACIVDDEGDWREVHDAKIQALESLIEEANGAPVLVAYHFKADLVRLRKALPKARVLDKNPQTIKDWNTGSVPVLLAHPMSAGHGLSLQYGGNIIAFFTCGWGLEERTQIIERIGPVRQRQAGFDRPVYVYNIVAEDTIDEKVLLRHATKRAVQDLLLEAMKEKHYD